MKVVFLCGHHSPYGRAHLEPIFNSKFEIIALVLATDARWAYFYSILSGKPIQNFKQQNAKFRVKQAVKHILTKLPGNFELKRNSLQNKYLDRYSEQEIVQLFEKYAVTSKYEFDINSEAFVAWVRSQEPDLIISAAYPQILKKSLLEIPAIGCINSHPSLLPRCRGAHPVFWAIASGEKRSGVTAHYMTESLDDGDIVAQRGFDLDPNTRYKPLYERILYEVPKLVEEVENFFLSGQYDGIPQDENEASYFRNDREIHRRIFFSTQTAEEIDRLVRACDGDASFFSRGKSIRVIQSAVFEANRNLTNNLVVPAGTVVDLDREGVYIKAREGIIQFKEIITRGSRHEGASIVEKLGWQIGMTLGK